MTAMIRTFPERREVGYEAACSLARCVAAVEQDKQQPDRQRQEWARTYGDRAVALLEEAMQKGLTDLAGLRQATALAPLRSQPAFQQLLAAPQRP